MNALIKFDPKAFDEHLRQNNPFTGGQCMFDLRGVRFISPSALAQLAAACHGLHASGQPATILIENDDVRAYLLRAGFFSALEGFATIRPEVSQIGLWLSEARRGTNPMLMELTKIESGAALPALLDQVVHVLRYRLRYKKYDAFDIATAVSEIAQNTFDHNQGTNGFIAMQAYGRDAKRFLEIAVADYGCGLVATLTRNPNYRAITTDLEAIHKAIELGVSEHDDPTRGTGLYHLLEITNKHQGSVEIRTGSGKVKFRGDRQIAWALRVPRMPGVQIALALPTKVA